MILSGLVRRIFWTVSVVLMLQIHQTTALNFTLYPREYADISCKTEQVKDGVCVYAYLCHEGVINTDGTGLVDLRFGDVCEDYFLRCCSKATPCAENRGKCVPKDKCAANMKLPKYKEFVESKDCDWSGYTCCPQSTEPVKPAKPTKPVKPLTTKKSTVPSSTVPEQCDGGKGTCVPESQCQNIHGIGLIQERSMECSSDDHICCPLNTEKPSCESIGGVCVLGNECAPNTDGVGIIEERSYLACNSEQQVCCPKAYVKTSDCGKVGGRCVPAGQCSSQLEFDVRSSDTSGCPTEGHVCCTSDVISFTTESMNLPRKSCFNGRGTCSVREKCKESVVTDTRKECDGSICCLPLETTTSTTTTQSTINHLIGRPCSSGKGQCSEYCDDIVLNDRSNVCGKLKCCGTEPEENCGDSGGKCIPGSKCAQKVEGNYEECENQQMVCCEKEITSIEPPDTPPATLPEYNPRGCGYRNDNGFLFKLVNDADGESQYGEFPWVVAIYSELHESESKFICGGSLIDPEVILTTADCVKSFRNRPEKLTVRAGEWDMRSTYEPVPYQERGVRLVKTHPTFKQSSLVNNVGLLFLDDKFDQTHTIDTVCLPPQDFEIYNGEVTATGWGSTPNNLTKAQQILKRLDLPFNQRSDCERILRRVMRKPTFKLDASFICAGGYPDEDTCRGDAGSPVVFPVPDDFQNRVYAVGMVSWGVGCGKPGVPAAYTDVGKFRNWIDAELQKEGIAMYSYDYIQHDD